jgi:signal transduction histidine kinase
VLLNKTARSSTLKLALVYVALFSASIFGLLAYVYWSTVSFLERNMDRTAIAERGLSMRAYDAGGRRGLIAFIDKRIDDQRLADWYYELADALFVPIAGNLPRWPAAATPRSAWSPFTWLAPPPGAADQGSLRATFRTLPDGDHLLLGRKAQALDGFAASIATALAATAALFFLLAAAAGISTARRSVTRIETINATSREIMRSGLGKRIPLRGSGDEWDELAANLNSMLDRIEQLVETNRQVSDNIAHDLRTPLTRMRARLERAATQSLDLGGCEALIHDTIGELDGVLRTFSSLLRISRIEASNHAAELPRLDLAELAAEVVELFDAAAEERSVRLVLSRAGRVSVRGDRDLLFDAVANLVDNAIKHGGSGGEVRVEVARSAEGPALLVADRGPGIPPSERQQVFKRFYRLEQSRNSPGNGLGLSLVAAVASLYGIRIEISDNAPGLKVELCFPTPENKDQTAARQEENNAEVTTHFDDAAHSSASRQCDSGSALLP